MDRALLVTTGRLIVELSLKKNMELNGLTLSCRFWSLVLNSDPPVGPVHAQLTCVPCVSVSLQAPSQALAQSVLAELPQQVATFFGLFGLKPPKEASAS